MTSSIFLSLSLFMALDGRYLVLGLPTARKGPSVGCDGVTLGGGLLAAPVDLGEAPPTIPALAGGGVCVCTGVTI